MTFSFDKKNIGIKISILLSMIGVIAIVIGASFAIFNTVLESSKKQVIKVGSIALKFTEVSSGLSTLEIGEATDAIGMASSSYYSFKIANIGTDKAYYEIKLLDDNSVTNSNALLTKYLRGNVTVDNVSKTPVYITENNRIVYQDVIDKDAEKTYNLRLWFNFGSLSNTEKDALLEKQAFFKIKIEAQQVTS